MPRPDRTFIALAIAVGERQEASHEDAIDGTARVHRYFSGGAPAPRRGRGGGRAAASQRPLPEVDSALDVMCRR